LNSTWKIKLFSGNSNPPLARAISEELGVSLGTSHVSRFSDGEIWVEIGENVRGQDVFVLQSTSTPVNDHLMELLIMIDALKRASAGRITAVMPYYGYGRQDRKVAPRTPISAKLCADLLAAAGVDRVMSMDLHAGQIQGFFDIPFDHLYSAPIMLEYLRGSLVSAFSPDDVVIVSPDTGGVERARAYAKRLGANLAIVDKRRTGPNVAEVMNIIGEVKGKVAVLLDDMIDTAGTITQAAAAIADRGAVRVFALSTHAVLSGPALKRLGDSKIEKIIVTDTIPLGADVKGSPKFVVLSVAKLLAEGIRRIHENDSVSSLFV
jgi:ribose-phosphate pyrophosphokinase